jgi:hypothetical protein
MKKLPVKNEQTPIALINLALDKGLDIEKFSKLFELQERWEKKESEKAFFTAFSNCQKTCPKIKNSKKVYYVLKEGGSISYSYAPLSEIAEQIREPLASNGLSYRWEFTESDKLITCTCIISHLDGHSKESKMSGFKDESGKKSLIQQTASTHTYLQRYTLIGALGLSSADEDVDGRGTPTKTYQKPTKSKEEQAEILEKWKHKFGELKTSVEIKLNSESFIKDAEKEGCPMEELKSFVHGIYAVLKKEALKKNKESGEQKEIELP